jgi:hypothetical protein
MSFTVFPVRNIPRLHRTYISVICHQRCCDLLIASQSKPLQKTNTRSILARKFLSKHGLKKGEL